MFLLVLVILGSILGSFKIEKENLDSAAMNVKTTVCIRGICAIVIFLDHLGLVLSIPAVLKPFTMVGYLYVSIFFFFSGYGLWGVSNKEGYLDDFLKKKLVKLLCPVVLAKILYSVAFHSKVMYSWYVYVICGLYILFFCCCKMFSRLQALKGIAVGILLYQIICFVLSIPVVWYRSCWPFLIGCLVYQFKDKLESFIKNKWLFFVLINTMLFLSFFLMAALADRLEIASLMVKELITVVLYAISSILCVIEIYSFTCKFSVTKNIGNLFCKIGDISYEIYLIHGFSFLLLTGIKGKAYYAYLALGITLLLATVLHIISKKMITALKL